MFDWNVDPREPSKANYASASRFSRMAQAKIVGHVGSKTLAGPRTLIGLP